MGVPREFATRAPPPLSSPVDGEEIRCVIELSWLTNAGALCHTAYSIDNCASIIGYFIPAPSDVSVGANQDEVAFVNFVHVPIVDCDHLKWNSCSLRRLRETGYRAVAKSE